MKKQIKRITPKSKGSDIQPMMPNNKPYSILNPNSTQLAYGGNIDPETGRPKYFLGAVLGVASLASSLYSAKKQSDAAKDAAESQQQASLNAVIPGYLANDKEFQKKQSLTSYYAKGGMVPMGGIRGSYSTDSLQNNDVLEAERKINGTSNQKPTTAINYAGTYNPALNNTVSSDSALIHSTIPQIYGNPMGDSYKIRTTSASGTKPIDLEKVLGSKEAVNNFYLQNKDSLINGKGVPFPQFANGGITNKLPNQQSQVQRTADGISTAYGATHQQPNGYDGNGVPMGNVEVEGGGIQGNKPGEVIQQDKQTGIDFIFSNRLPFNNKFTFAQVAQPLSVQKGQLEKVIGANNIIVDNNNTNIAKAPSIAKGNNIQRQTDNANRIISNSNQQIEQIDSQLEQLKNQQLQFGISQGLYNPDGTPKQTTFANGGTNYSIPGKYTDSLTINTEPQTVTSAWGVQSNGLPKYTTTQNGNEYNSNLYGTSTNYNIPINSTNSDFMKNGIPNEYNPNRQFACGGRKKAAIGSYTSDTFLSQNPLFKKYDTNVNTIPYTGLFSDNNNQYDTSIGLPQLNVSAKSIQQPTKSIYDLKNAFPDTNDYDAYKVPTLNNNFTPSNISSTPSTNINPDVTGNMGKLMNNQLGQQAGMAGLNLIGNLAIRDMIASVPVPKSYKIQPTMQNKVSLSNDKQIANDSYIGLNNYISHNVSNPQVALAEMQSNKNTYGTTLGGINQKEELINAQINQTNNQNQFQADYINLANASKTAENQYKHDVGVAQATGAIFNSAISDAGSILKQSNQNKMDMLGMKMNTALTPGSVGNELGLMTYGVNYNDLNQFKGDYNKGYNYLLSKGVPASDIDAYLKLHNIKKQ